MNLPPDLLIAIASKEGGRVVLVTGAGCSVEGPTNLPMAGQCSVEAHRKLVLDGILNEGDCIDPSDLSALADLVKSKRDGRQAELVDRLPITEFKNASPNEGHRITAALLVEGAIANVITLNFDLALSHALADIGVGSGVSVIAGPEQHSRMGRSNLIYLHRNIDSNPEDLILTTKALDEAWVDKWEEFVAKWAMVTPVTVFAGLGSSCGVLRHAAAKLKDALGKYVHLLFANPDTFADAIFAKEMGISDADYVQCGWVELMRKLGERFHLETIARIYEACNELSQREGWVDPITGGSAEDIEALTSLIKDLDMLSFGKARAAWLMKDCAYPKFEESHLFSIADLLLAIGYISGQLHSAIRIKSDGEVIFDLDGVPGVKVRLFDGSSRKYRWLTLESELKQRQRTDPHFRLQSTKRILACGMTGQKPGMASPPESIIAGGNGVGSIIDAEIEWSYWGIDEIRTDPTAIDRFLA